MPLRNFRLQDVKRLLRNAEELELCHEAVQRLKWFQYALEHDSNVSLTCRHFGISRSTFLRWADRFDARDIRSLEEQSRRPLTVRTPETNPATVELIRILRTEHPLLGKEPICALLKERYGIELSSSTVGRIIKRHALFFGNTQSHENKRAIENDDNTDVTEIRTAVSDTTSEDFLDDPFLQLVPGVTS